MFLYFKCEWGETLRALAIKYKESTTVLLVKTQHVKLVLREKLSTNLPDAIENEESMKTGTGTQSHGHSFFLFSFNLLLFFSYYSKYLWDSLVISYLHFIILFVQPLILFPQRVMWQINKERI